MIIESGIASDIEDDSNENENRIEVNVKESKARHVHIHMNFFTSPPLPSSSMTLLSKLCYIPLTNDYLNMQFPTVTHIR